MHRPAHDRQNAATTPLTPMIESLEDRRLLSAVSLSAGGTLFVEGTRRNDDIVVRRNPADRREIEVRHNGQSETFAGRVRRIVVLTGAGDDTALVDRRVNPNCTLDGGAGDDSLFGGAGDDSVNGDVGDDSCVGGAGNDSIRGGDGADHCDGSDGDDSIRGESGRDHVHGGHGDDAFDNNREVEDQDDDNDRHHHGGGLEDDDPADHDMNDDRGGATGGNGNGADDGPEHDANDDHGGMRDLLA